MSNISVNWLVLMGALSASALIAAGVAWLGSRF